MGETSRVLMGNGSNPTITFALCASVVMGHPELGTTSCDGGMLKR